MNEVTSDVGAVRAMEPGRAAYVSPIHCLPPELLSTVFFHCTAGNAQPIMVVNDEKSAGYTHGWLGITHVCRHWRTVALATATLWRRPDFSRPMLASAMLERAHDAPLEILVVDARLEPRDAVRSAVKNHISHIRTLDICVNDEALPQEIFREMVKPAPLLTRLTIHRHQDFPSHTLSLPDSFLGNETPPLTELHLENVLIPLDLPLFQNMTSLLFSATRREFRTRTLLSTNHWIHILRNMPGLQRLKLHDVLPPAHSEAPPPTTPPVHLAHLSYASLSSSIPQIAKLLQYITLPDAAHIDLYNCRFAAISTRAMFTELASHLNPLIAKLVGNAEIESLRVTDKHPFIKGITPSDCIIFEMHTTGFSPDKVASEFWSLRPRKNVTSLNLVKVPRLCLDIRLLQDDFWHESEQVVPAICKRLDLHFLHTLSLELKGSELHGAALHKCFGTIPKLTDLTITQSVIIPFFEAVMDPGFDPDSVVPFDSNLWSTTAQEMETPTTFDHLNFLRVHDSDFTATRFKHRWDTLIHLLGVDWYRKSQARRGGQATLKLVFSNSVLFGQQISQLRERSEELEFEGCRFIEDDARWKEYSAPSPWPE